MTVATTTNKSIGTGNGLTTTFPFTFGTLPTGDLVVSLFDLTGVEIPQVENTDYTVLGEGAEDGGAVVFNVAPPNLYTVLIRRILPITQPDDLKNQGSYYPRTVERMFDRRTMVDQQMQETLDRSFTLPPQVTGVSTQLPVPEASNIVGWDQAGTGLRNYALSDLATSIVYGNKIYQTFLGTAVQTSFALSNDPGSLGNLDVSIDGVTQVNGIDFTLNGLNVVFSVAPANGAVILVRYDQALPIGAAAADNISYTPASTGVTATVRAFLDLLWTAGANAGAALIRFLQAGTGSVARTLQDKSREVISAKDFGAIGDGVANDATSIQLAVNYALSRGKASIHFPAGRYRINSTIAAAISGISGVSFTGDGMGITELVITAASGNGFSITAPDGNWWLNASPSSAVSFRDLTISTEAQGIGTLVFIDGGSLEGRPTAPVTFRNVEMRGFGGFTDRGAKFVDLLDTGAVFFSHCRFILGGPGSNTAIGIDIRATDGSTDPTSFMIDNCEFLYGDVAVQIGNHVEGVYWTNSSAVNSNRGIVWSAAAESGLHAIGGHMNCFERNFDLNGVFDGTISGMLLYKNGSSATFRHIRSVNGGSFTCNNNVLRGGGTVGEIGIEIDSVPDEGTHGYIISSNQFANVHTAIRLGATARKVYVGNNNYNGCTVRVSNSAVSAYVEQRTHAKTQVFNLTSGASSENIDVSIPAGVFYDKPTAGFCMTSGNTELLGFYDFDSAFSTATNARFILKHKDAVNIVPGVYRFSIMLSE